jgi:uncharacterized protein YjbJ (UPF0337 family)
MRCLAIFATCAAISVGLAPMADHTKANAQTTQNEKAIWETIKGSWNQTKGTVKEQWGKLTDDDLLEIEGRRDRLVGTIQVRYGISKEEAEAQVGAWELKHGR